MVVLHLSIPPPPLPPAPSLFLANGAFSISAAGIIINDDPSLQMAWAEGLYRFILYHSIVNMNSLSSQSQRNRRSQSTGKRQNLWFFHWVGSNKHRNGENNIGLIGWICHNQCLCVTVLTKWKILVFMTKILKLIVRVWKVISIIGMIFFAASCACRNFLEPSFRPVHTGHDVKQSVCASVSIRWQFGWNPKWQLHHKHT